VENLRVSEKSIGRSSKEECGLKRETKVGRVSGGKAGEERNWLI